MANSVWRAIKDDFRLVALGHSLHEFRILRWLLKKKWEDLGDRAAQGLLEEIQRGGWLDDGSFRSRWGYCFSDHLGGRTTNGLESFHRVIKDAMLKRKCTLTLLQLIWALKTADWEQISAHNKTVATRRVITDSDKRESLRCGPFAKLNRNLPTSPVWDSLPEDLRGCSKRGCSGGNNCRRVSHFLGEKKQHYLFTERDSFGGLSSNAELVEFVMQDPRVTSRISGAFSSLAEAKKFISCIHIVSYESSTDPACSVLDGGPYCTCLDYIHSGKCMHIVTLHRYIGEDEDVTWQRLTARMERASTRDRNGRISHTLPSQTRYGVGRYLGEQRRTEQAQARQLGLDEFEWPPHIAPAACSTDKRTSLTKVAGCCGGIFDTDSVKCSSRKCASGRGWARWWHIDCAEAWARASGIAPPDVADEKSRWYCPRCQPPKRRRV